MRKPNYRFERAERDRAKKARNDKKLQRQQEKAETRADDGAPEPTAENEFARDLIDQFRRSNLGLKVKTGNTHFVFRSDVKRA